MKPPMLERDLYVNRITFASFVTAGACGCLADALLKGDVLALVPGVLLTIAAFLAFHVTFSSGSFAANADIRERCRTKPRWLGGRR